jgi:hypothetical protein
MEFRFDLFEVTRHLIARPGKVKGDLREDLRKTLEIEMMGKIELKNMFDV